MRRVNCLEFENVVVAMARDEVMEAEARQEGLSHAEVCARCARRLANERMLSETVAATIAEDGAKEAPRHVSRMLMGAMRARKAARMERRRTWLRRAVTGVAAAVLLIGGTIVLRRAPETRVSPAASTGETAGASDGVDEVTTDFIPLDYGPSPAGATSVVRVELPRTALVAFGLPLNEDRSEDLVQADFLMDEDVLMRAIRFVE